MLRLLLLLLFPVIIYGQSASPFTIEHITVTKRSDKKKPSDFRHYTSYFYEDDLYTADKTCHGEWGGTLRLHAKKDGTQYECALTCPVSVIKLDEKYYAAGSLSHMFGSCEILQIDDPAALKKTEPASSKEKKTAGPWNGESASMQGTRTLVDSVGMRILAGFPYEGKPYYIVRDSKSGLIYLARLTDDKLEPLDTLSRNGSWANNPEVVITKDQHYLLFVGKKTGYLDIYGNSIKIYKFQ